MFMHFNERALARVNACAGFTIVFNGACLQMQCIDMHWPK